MEMSEKKEKMHQENIMRRCNSYVGDDNYYSFNGRLGIKSVLILMEIKTFQCLTAQSGWGLTWQEAPFVKICTELISKSLLDYMIGCSWFRFEVSLAHINEGYTGLV